MLLSLILSLLKSCSWGALNPGYKINTLTAVSPLFCGFCGLPIDCISTALSVFL